MQLTAFIPEEVRFGVTAARTIYNARDRGPNEPEFWNDEGYVEYFLNKSVRDWCAMALNTPLPPDPLVVNGVPQEVSRRQGIQALINTGRLPMVQSAIDAIPDELTRMTMQNEWDNATTFLRQRPSLIALAQALGMGDDDLDQLFALAGSLA